MEIVQAVKKLNSISREWLNFRRRPILCTTLYRNPMQATNFGGTFDQLFLRIFLSNFHRRCLSISSIPWCKKSKMTKNSNQGGSCLNTPSLMWRLKKKSVGPLFIWRRQEGNFRVRILVNVQTTRFFFNFLIFFCSVKNAPHLRPQKNRRCNPTQGLISTVVQMRLTSDQNVREWHKRWFLS